MTNKAKNILLLIGFLLLIILCYQLAISKTVTLKKEFNNLKQQETLFENTPKQISLLKQKQKYYDSLLATYQINGNSLQNNLLKTINSFAGKNNIKVVSFIEPHTVYNNDLKINTYQFILEGSYNNILKLIHRLEQNTKFGEVTNLHFEKKINFRTNKKYLQASLLLKNFG